MSHTLRYDVNCSILFTEVDLLDRPAAAHAAGFDAVELWWPFPTATPSPEEVDALISAVDRAGVTLVGLNFFAGDMPAGDRGLVSWPGRQEEFAASVQTALEIGRQTGCKAFNALYGRSAHGTPEERTATADHNLRLACAEAARDGAVVLLEPVSGFEDYPLRTAADVADVIARLEGLDNLQLLLDLYHLATNGDDLAAAVATYADLVGHVQIADAPGRGAPGTGSLPLDTHLEALQQRGYDGWVGLEYSAATTSEESLGWLPTARRSHT
jgi:hydroxypyruvate isomerase